MPRRSPLPQQRAAFRRYMHADAAAFLMEMRLGKTQPCVRWVMTRPGAARVLVVAPIAAQRGWVEHVERDGGRCEVLAGKVAARESRALEAEPGWYVTNYQALHRRGKPTAVATAGWDAIVLDESTAIKNPRAAVTKVALKHLDAPYRAICTGLPDPEGVEDVVCQMLWLFGACMGHRSFWSWRARHCMPGFGGGWVVKSKSAQALRDWLRERCFVLSRKDAGVANRKARVRLDVELPRRVAAAIRIAERDYEVPDAGLITKNALVVLQWSLGLTGGRFKHCADLHHDAKFAELARLAAGELKREPLITYCAQVDEVTAAAKLLDRYGGVAVVTGAMSEAERASEVRRFQRGRVRHFVATPQSVRMGVDLSRASATAYLSNSMSAETRSQSEMRMEETRQKPEPLWVGDIVCPGEADDDAARALGEKRMGTIMAKKAMLDALRKRRGA